jgi:hypothetical protein
MVISAAGTPKDTTSTGRSHIHHIRSLPATNAADRLVVVINQDATHASTVTASAASTSVSPPG